MGFINMKYIISRNDFLFHQIKILEVAIDLKQNLLMIKLVQSPRYKKDFYLSLKIRRTYK